MIPLLIGTQAVRERQLAHSQEREKKQSRKGKSLDAELQLFTSGASVKAVL